MTDAVARAVTEAVQRAPDRLRMRKATWTGTGDVVNIGGGTVVVDAWIVPPEAANDPVLILMQEGSNIGFAVAGGGGGSGGLGVPIPVGGIVAYGGGSAPAKFLKCDGAAVSRTTYATLFAAIGSAYGTGDGTTTFNVPNLKGRVPVGQDSGEASFNALGETGGEMRHVLTVAEMPSHNHGISDPGHNHGMNDPGHSHDASTHLRGSFNAGAPDALYAYGNGGAAAVWLGFVGGRGTGVYNSGSGTGVSVSDSGGGGAHNIMPPYQIINYLIRAV
jgi:microcystin-dependent protein